MASTDGLPLTPLDVPTKARLLREAAAHEPLWIVAHGGSMGRTIPTGSSVLVAQCSSPRRGQIWAYCEPCGTVVVHRYRRRTEAGHVLQGDTRTRSDPPVGDDLLIGRVTAVRRGGRARSVGWRDRCRGECQRLPRVAVARAARLARRLPRRDR